jgi:uncharacterized protein (TIGR04222 family)
MRRAAIAVAAVAALVLALAGVALADEGWTVDRFDAQILVGADGVLSVTESIDVDFGPLQKHGIFRRIPVRYRSDERRDRVYDLRVVSVTDAAGRSWPYSRSDEGPDVIVKIGDPDRTISGKQAYRITYTVAAVLNGFADHDELYWNVNGEWPVRTRALTAHVQLARGEISQVACFQGPLGSKEACQIAMRAGSADAAATRLLNVNEQMSVVVGFPKGIVPPPQAKLESRPRDIDAWWDATPISVGGATAVLALGLGWIVWRWWAAGRDPGGPDTIVPEYEPPERTRPAEVGLIVDESADTKDLTATIVDLAVRGYLRIEEIPAGGLFSRKDWTLVKLREIDDALAPYERRLFDGLFATSGEVKLSELRGTFHGTLYGAERELYKASVTSGWFPTDPDRVRSRWAFIGCGTILVGAGLAALLGIFYGAALVGLALALIGTTGLVVARAMPRRTQKGRDLLWHIRGFRRYMETAETERQRFAERENIFATYLPYAIVFGLVSKWAAAFSDIDAQRATQGWYVGPGIVNIPSFSSDLSSFSGGLASAISSTPGSSGSSSFGGGGGSGGGGGGGGGGSW